MGRKKIKQKQTLESSLQAMRTAHTADMARTAIEQTMRRFARWTAVVFGLVFALAVIGVLTTEDPPSAELELLTSQADGVPRLPDGSLPATLIELELTADGRVRLNDRSYLIGEIAGPASAVFGTQVDMARVRVAAQVDAKRSAELVRVLGEAGVARNVVLTR